MGGERWGLDRWTSLAHRENIRSAADAASRGRGGGGVAASEPHPRESLATYQTED